ncbi:hypothetical protein Hanom_Chr08g00747431 [Helianthus anomalus]
MLYMSKKKKKFFGRWVLAGATSLSSATKEKLVTILPFPDPNNSSPTSEILKPLADRKGISIGSARTTRTFKNSILVPEVVLFGFN